MLCDKCGKNNATTHIKQIINGVVTERNLCSSCAAEEGYSKFPHGGLADMLASMFGDISGLGIESNETRCPVCGATHFRILPKPARQAVPSATRPFTASCCPYLKTGARQR